MGEGAWDQRTDSLGLWTFSWGQCKVVGRSQEAGGGWRRTAQPSRPTYLAHDVLIVRQSQAQVSDVAFVALMQQRRGRCWDPGGLDP